MNQPDSPVESRSERLDLRIWRSEVREFCEDTLRQLRQITDLLNAELSESDGAPGKIDRETSDELPPVHSSEIDSSRSRLESLKRKLSEKLGNANPTEPPGTDSGT